MIFPSIAENEENMIFTLSVFTKMLFFMQCNILPVARPYTGVHIHVRWGTYVWIICIKQKKESKDMGLY